MRYWFDTEFIEDGKTIDLISIGMVAEDGAHIYRQNRECNFSLASDWVKANVLPHLIHFDMETLSPKCPAECDPFAGTCPWRDRRGIAVSMVQFIPMNDKPEFWGYYADYDWVVLCQLFGTMMDLPKGWPMYCRDIKQWCDDLGNPALPEQGKGEHHALADARWNRQAWDFLSVVAVA